MRTIGSFAFNGCIALEEITLGNKITSIEQMAFDNMTATIYCPTQNIADMITSANAGSTTKQPTIIVK